MHRVRISDIAEELGLSTATVSNVLHGKTHKVSNETVQRVQALLEERQYIPSMAGILLAQKSSRIIGVIINDHEKYERHTLEDSYIASSLNRLSTEIEANGQFMMVKKTTSPAEIIRFASMWNLDGMVLMGFCDQDYCQLRSHMHVPFVVYDGYGEDAERICNITIDNFNGGFQVGTYLKAAGHTRAVCIADNQVCIDKDRYCGFCAGFGKEGADFLQVPMQKEQRIQFYKENLAQIRGYTAAFAVSDAYAFEFVRFLQQQGICVPEDISVVGFDDTPLCGLLSPTLSSVRQDVAQRAKIAMRCLTDLKQGKPVPPRIVLPVQFVQRESTQYTKQPNL